MKLSPESYNIILELLSEEQDKTNENHFFNESMKQNSIRELRIAIEEIEQIGVY